MVGSAQSRVVKDRQLHPWDTEVLGDPFDHLARRTTQVAAGLGDKGDPYSGTVGHDPTV